MDCSVPGLSVPHYFPKLAQIHAHGIDDDTHPPPPLMPSSPLPSIFPTIRDFSNESAILIRWPKYWSFSFSISPSNKYLELISLMIDWFDLCFPGDSQECCSALQLKDINFSVFCLLYGPALRTIYDHWEDHSLDYTNFCQQSNVSTFQHTA